MQLKDFVSITASMMNWMRAAQDKVSDFEEGSVIRTLLEAPAAEIDELYQQMFAGIREAIPVSVYRTFGFTTLERTAAAGIVRVTIDPISTDTLIPAGTIFQQTAAGRPVQYLSTADVMLPATYSTADVPVTADTPGSAGNTPPTVTFVMSPEPLGFVSAASSAGMSGGMDGETEDARQARFREYVASLQRGTIRALEYGATLATVTNAAGVVVERVTSAERRDVKFARGEIIFRVTKTHAPRVIPMTSSLRRLLARALAGKGPDEQLVFRNRSGGRLSSLSSRWRNTVDTTPGVLRFRMHDLRHTYAIR